MLRVTLILRTQLEFGRRGLTLNSNLDKLIENMVLNCSRILIFYDKIPIDPDSDIAPEVAGRWHTYPLVFSQ